MGFVSVGVAPLHTLEIGPTLLVILSEAEGAPTDPSTALRVTKLS